MGAAAAAIAATATTAAAATAAGNPPAAGANNTQALNDFDSLKRSTKIPLYYGHKVKDSITAHLLIKRIEKAAIIATWDNANKIIEFYMVLRDKAIFWWESLQDDNLNLDDWDIFKKEFLKMYKPKYSAHTTCDNFANLIQKSGKSINDYHVRVQTAYKCLMDNKPTIMAALRLARTSPTRLSLKGLTKWQSSSRTSCSSLASMTTFTIRSWRLGRTTLPRAWSARELEAIQLDHKRSQKIAAVKA
jgi:hypothetical protein